MEPFQTHRGIIIPLDKANIDTDQIIPKQFLKSISRTGFGEHLFFDWRYLPDGKPNENFPLNQTPYQQGSILLTRHNFGCGSSREHAVWAIQQSGIKAVIAPRKEDGPMKVPAFADIFRNNSIKNGLLTIELSSAEADEIFQMAGRFPGLEATVDLQEQRVVLHLDEEIAFHFDVDPANKTRLIHGLDDIGTTLLEESAIRVFEKKHNTQIPTKN